MEAVTKQTVEHKENADPSAICRPGGKHVWRVLAVMMCASAAFAQSPSPTGLPITYERLLKASEEPGNWLTYGGDYRSHHYSTLKQITVENVHRLRAKWIYQMHRPKVETTPIVVDGVMYVTRPPSDVIALDTETGRALWTFEYRLPTRVYTCCGEVNRGLAILGRTLYLTTLDAQLIALDAGSGRVLWQKALADPALNYTATGAPLAVKDKVIGGIAGAEGGIRGFRDEYSVHLRDLENLVAYLSSLRPGRTGSGPAPRQPSMSEVWTFDRLENIGGHKTTVLGEPRIIDTPIGKAVEFDGVDDALFIDNHPLAGASAFTWEAIFRPDGGQREQRWFHLSEKDPATGADTENRMLFEIRVIDDKWFLDSYNQSGAASKALMNKTALHPLGVWHHVASVYDGKEFSNYVNGVREGAAELQLAPHGPGHTSVGVRINKVFYFKGAVHQARFTKRALSPSEFLKVP